MLGLIMNSFAGKGPTQLGKIPHSKKRSLEIGTPVKYYGNICGATLLQGDVLSCIATSRDTSVSFTLLFI